MPKSQHPRHRIAWSLLAAVLLLPTSVPAQNLLEQNGTLSDVGISPKDTVFDIAHDQADIWSSPKNLRKRKNLLPVLAVAGAAAGLALAVDAPAAHYFRQTDRFQAFNSALPGEDTKLGIIALPAAFYGVSLLKNNSYGEETALLAAEAAVDAGIITLVTKPITGRIAPAAIPANGNFSDTWFKTSRGDFPSSHTATAFALATVISQRYSNHKWAPFAAYGAAALVGFSTITQSGHYPSDVFVGAALGYAVAHFQVLHRHTANR